MPGNPGKSSSRKPGKVRLGTSGWAYSTWRPGFYPVATPLKNLLQAYSAQLSSVEVNYTFRSLPSATVTANWLAQTTANFRFSFKAPQQVTHILRLRDASAAMEKFLAALHPVAESGRLGPVLFQLPPHQHSDPKLLSEFLSTSLPAGFAHAWEFRHPSWFQEEVYRILAAHGGALCAAESDTLRSPDLDLTPTLRVFRLRCSAYTAQELKTFATHFSQLAERGADVYAYLMHEEQPTGPLRALEILHHIPAELLA